MPRAHIPFALPGVAALKSVPGSGCCHGNCRAASGRSAREEKAAAAATSALCCGGGGGSGCHGAQQMPARRGREAGPHRFGKPGGPLRAGNYRSHGAQPGMWSMGAVVLPQLGKTIVSSSPSPTSSSSWSLKINNQRIILLSIFQMLINFYFNYFVLY